MKILKFIASILLDILHILIGILILAVMILILALLVLSSMIIPALISILLFDGCEYAFSILFIVEVLSIAIVLEGINPFKSIKKYIVTKWNESGQS